MTVQVSETCSFPPAAGMTALCSVTRTGSRSSFLPDGAFSQVRRDPSGSQPPPGASGSATVALTRATTCPPAVQDRHDQVVTGKITVEAGHAAREQLRAAPGRAASAGSAPRPGTIPGSPRASRGPARAVSATTRSCGNGAESVRGPGRAEHGPVRRGVRQVHQHPVRGEHRHPASVTADGSSSPISGPAACQNRSSITSAGISSRHSVTTFEVGTCHSRANGTSASSPATLGQGLAVRGVRASGSSRASAG